MNNIMLNFNDTIYKMIHKELTSVLETVPNHRVIMANAVDKKGFHNYLHESDVIITDGFYFKDDKEFVSELNKLISRGRKKVIVINYESFTPNRIEQDFIDDLIKNGILRVCNIKLGESLDFEYIKHLLTTEPTSFQLKGFLGYTDDEYRDFYEKKRNAQGAKKEADNFINPQATLDIDVDDILNDFILDEDEDENEVVVDNHVYQEQNYNDTPSFFDNLESEFLEGEHLSNASAIETSDEVMEVLKQVKKEAELEELGIIEEDIEEYVAPEAEFDFEFNLDSLGHKSIKNKENQKEKHEAKQAEVENTVVDTPVQNKVKNKKKNKKKKVDQSKVNDTNTVKVEGEVNIEPVVNEDEAIALVKAEVNRNAKRGPKTFDEKGTTKGEVMPESNNKTVQKEEVKPVVLNKATENFGENVRFMLRLNNINPIMESIDFKKVLIIHLEVDQTTKYNLQSLDNILGSRMVNLDILSSNIMIEKNNYNESMNVIYRLYDTSNLIDFSLLSNYIDEFTKENPDTKVIVISDHKHNIHKFNKLFKYVNITCGDNTNELMIGMKIKEELTSSRHNVTLCMFSGTEHLIKNNAIGKKVPKVVKIK